MQPTQNLRRALAAESALATFATLRGETDELGTLGRFTEQNLIDLLTDLAHFCDARNLRMEKCFRTARMHYLEERGPKGAQFDHFQSRLRDAGKYTRAKWARVAC